MIVDKRPKRIALPAAFEALLARDGGLHAAVLATVAAFEPWVEDNKLPFFPGYTDHGPDHIRSVMATAAALAATTRAWRTRPGGAVNIPSQARPGPRPVCVRRLP